MVPGHGEGRVELPQLPALIGPRGGVVYLAAAVKAPLKGGGVFADVVGQPGQPGLFLCAEGTGEGRRQLGRAGQVLQDRLFPAVLRYVG